MPTTIADLAKAAGVSLSTVSRALADNPRVAKETRRRIQALAVEIGYVPSAIARGLATRRTYSLGVVVRDLVDLFIAEVVRLMDVHALELGYSLILSHAGNDPQRELAAINILRQQRVDAIVMPDPSVSDSFVSLVTDKGVPVVLLNRMSYVYSVNTDNRGCARMAVDHLLDLGHRRVAYIAGMRCRYESEERQAGYESALAERGLGIEPSLITQGDTWPVGGQECMRRLLAIPDPPTAVFCFNDATAIGAIGVIHAAGMRVPQDISVVGFDDFVLCPYLDPPLTSIGQDKEQLARLSIDMAHRLIAGEQVAAQPALPGRLVIRASTAPPSSGRIF